MSHHLQPAESAITQDDAFLENAIAKANLPALLMSIVHITGDSSLLRGPLRPGPAVFGGETGDFNDDEVAQIHSLALEALKTYRDGGCKLPSPPNNDTILEMMSYAVGTEVPDAYVPMMLEELALDGKDARDLGWDDTVSDRDKQAFSVLVIGAGMSGLLAAIRLEDAGIPYTVIEKNDAVGGTWLENKYPGCRVDVGNHFYCYSFEPNHDWSEYFSQQAELQEYFERCGTRYGVRDKIRFGTEVISARFDEENSTWEVRLRSRDGGEEVLRVNVLISAVGQLNRPKIPAIEGLETFSGPAFHSAEFDPDIDLAGKRVAVVGTGASALQMVPELAKTAAQLYVFQRSPGWMLPNAKYHTQVCDEVKWLMKHVPFYARWNRFLIFWPGSDGLWPSLKVDPDWPHPERSVNAMNEAMRVGFIQYMETQVGDDAELLAKVTPSYPPFGKRILQDNGSWLQALTRDNVELVSDAVARMTENAVVAEDGTEYPVDVVIFATGFHANKFLWPMEIVGRDGIKLNEKWGDDPAAYLGITVPSFPNLFCLYGPGTNLAHAGSIIFHSECQVRYIMGCIKAMLETKASSMECKQDVHDEYNQRLDECVAQMVWSHPGMDSWYKNSKGRVTILSPWLLVDYWGWTKEPKLADFDFTSN